MRARACYGQTPSPAEKPSLSAVVPLPAVGMLNQTVSRVRNPLAGAGGGGSHGLLAHGMRGLEEGVGGENATATGTAAARASCQVTVSKELQEELVGSGMIVLRQLHDLTEAFELVAEPNPDARTVSLPELRAILRILGCESLASETLTDLQALDDYRHGYIRRPPLSLLAGLQLLESVPPPGRSSIRLEVTPSTARNAEQTRITFDDFLRVLSRGRLRNYLSQMSFAGSVHTLTLLDAMYELAADSAGQRIIDRTDLMIACAGVNTHLSQSEMDELWGILANADTMKRDQAGSNTILSGWMIRRGQARRKRVWCTLNETGRGRLQFRDKEHGAAKQDFLEMAHCVRVYNAAARHSRRMFLGLFGGQHETADVEQTTAKLHAIWEELDEDKDGTLDETELRKMLQRMGTTMTDKKFARWVKQLDTDKDGRVSFEDMEFWARKQSEEARNLITSVQLDGLWEQIDLDGSGELNADELAAVLDLMGQPVGPRKLQKMMQRLDTDGNGTVSKDEFSVWWQQQSEVARSQVALSVDGDEDEAEEDAADESESTTIGITMRNPVTGREHHHMLEATTKEDMQTWLDALEECRLFHHNYHRQHISYGEFLLGMANVPSTPLSDRFDMFASIKGTRRRKDGTESQVIQRCGSALVDRPVDEVRADELFEALGAMEKFGVAVVKREQKRRDKHEMMARLQRSKNNQLHALSPAEQKLMLHIERGVMWRCFMYGALSAGVSGAFELLVGLELDTSDGLHHGTAYLAPNATCDVNSDLCERLDPQTMAYYWIFAIAIPIAVCSIIEIGAIYLDSLRSAMLFVGVVGMQLLPLDDARLFVALSLTRAGAQYQHPHRSRPPVLLTLGCMKL